MTPGGVQPEGGAATSPTPAAPSTPSTAAVNDDAPELDDFEGPEDGDDEPDGSEDTSLDATEDGDDADPDQQIAALRERLKAAEQALQEAASAEAAYQEAQRVQQQQHAEAYWNNALAQAKDWYASRRNAIFQEARTAIDPAGFVERETEFLDREYQTWLDQYHQQREQAFWEFAMQQALPNYVRDVVAHYGLPQDAMAELMEYPVNLIPREAEKMKARRSREAALKRAATQAARKAKREAMMENGVFPGSGRSANTDVPLDSDDYYNSIPWQRGGFPAR